jgi:hypothetical protein
VFKVTWRNYGFSLANWFKQLSTKLTTSADVEIFPRELKNNKHYRYLPQGLERSIPHENNLHTRETCWASCHTRRLAQQVALMCGRLIIISSWRPPLKTLKSAVYLFIIFLRYIQAQTKKVYLHHGIALLLLFRYVLIQLSELFVRIPWNWITEKN